jgi:hypothetical protein
MPRMEVPDREGLIPALHPEVLFEPGDASASAFLLEDDEATRDELVSTTVEVGSSAVGWFVRIDDRGEFVGSPQQPALVVGDGDDANEEIPDVGRERTSEM